MKFYSLLFQSLKIYDILISDIFRSFGGSTETSLSETTGESGMIAALMSDPKKLFTVLAIYAAAAIIGYLAGGFSLSYILARRRGFDIRKTGTKNAGASNAAVTMGWKIGVLVGACDIFKGFAAVLAVKLICRAAFPALASELSVIGVVTGIFCVIGHMHPAYLRFRGGKGFATYLGMILGIDWKFFLIVGVLIILVSLLSDYIVMGTMVTMVSFPVYNILWRKSAVAAIVTATLSLYIIYRHRKNLDDILHGRERRISGLYKKKKEQ